MRVVITTMMFLALTGGILSAGELHDAVEEGDLKRVKELLTQNPKIIDVEDVNGNTALHLSTMYNRKEIAEFLFEHGAKSNIFTASYLGQHDTVKALLQKNPELVKAKDMHGNTALHNASTLEVMRCLLDNGAEVDIENNFGGTPLYLKAGDKDLAEYLISRGAKIDITALCLMGKVDKIKELLVKNPKLVHTSLNNGATLLHVVNDIGTAKLLLDNGAIIGATDENGFMPIHTATIENKIEIVKFLIDRGADIHAKCMDDWTPLHFAIHGDLYDMTKMLINQGANVNAGMGLFHMGNTPIRRAVERGNIKIVKLLIEKGADISSKNNMGEKLLFSATTKEVAELLIEHGIDVNYVSESSGWTALHEAANPEVAEVLISKGAKINIKDKMERTPLDRAIEDERMAVARFLIRKGGKGENVDFTIFDEPTLSKETLDIFKAAEQGLVEKVNEFLDNDPNLVKTRGGCADETPLHCASTREVAELLIRRGANIHVMDSFGRTPLHRAASIGYTEVAELLITKGADVNAKTPFIHNTPLHEAAQNGHVDMVMLLIGNGADVNVKCEGWRSPLHFAAEMRHKEIAQLLIAAGAETKGIGLFDAEKAGIINEVAPDMDIFEAVRLGFCDRVKALVEENPTLVKVKDVQGNTPLHLTNDNNIAYYLITRGADVNARNKQGFTPLHFAVGKGSYEITLLLVRNKADVNAEDDSGFTALLIAALYKLDQTTDMLTAQGAEIGILEASALGSMEQVKSLIKAKPEIINKKGPYGWTPLYVAINANQIQVVEFLLEKRANVQSKDNRGNAVLHYVDTPKMANILIQKGADINAKGKHGRTPLHHLTYRGQKEIIEFLINKGADVSLKDDDNKTPLDIANEKGLKEIADILKKHIQSP